MRKTLLLMILSVPVAVAGWLAAAQLDAAVAPRSLKVSDTLAATVQPSEKLAIRVVSDTARRDEIRPEADLMGRFLMTRYYVAEEFGRVAPAPAPPAEDGVVFASAAPAGVTIYDDKGCRPIATLAPKFAALLDMEGTGKLRDGRVINVTKPCRCGHSPCYRAVPGGARWGLSATMRPLQPFRTISVDPAVIALGSMVYIAELDGLTMPGRAPWGGFVHDGCVIASDVGGAIDGKQVDFFVGKVAYKQALDVRKKMRHVTIHDGKQRCAASRHWVAPRIGS